MAERHTMERILGVLKPYAANWSGSLGRGDLVIPQREISHLIHEILNALNEADDGGEASDAELFHALSETRRCASLQDQVARLRRSFRILKRE